MNSTPAPKAIEPDEAVIARADERLAHAYEQIARADEQLARVTEQLAKMERDAAPALARLFRAHGCPVIWTHVAYLPTGEDCGAWGTRSDTPDSLQNIKEGSRRAAIDERCEIAKGDIVINKRMASAFFETNLGSLFTWHRVDTVIVTGGSTSGCVRATVVDSLSRGYRTVVPEECVADKHESPHFANLYDMALKYADILPVAEVVAFMEQYKPAN